MKKVTIFVSVILVLLLTAYSLFDGKQTHWVALVEIDESRNLAFIAGDLMPFGVQGALMACPLNRFSELVVSTLDQVPTIPIPNNPRNLPIGTNARLVTIDKYHQLIFFTISILTAVFVTITHPSPLSAHGSGPAYLKVNERYAQSNLSASVQDPQLKIGQDRSPYEKYLVNTPINFEIDIANFPIPENLKKEVQIRWIWDEGDTNYGKGTKISHTYDQIGSHHISMQGKLPNESDFATVNTITVDVVPDMNYIVPSATISVPEFGLHAYKPLHFTANVTKDPSTEIESYFWKLDEKVYKTESAPTHNYNQKGYLAKQVILRITDKNGLEGFAYLALVGDAGDTQKDNSTTSNGSRNFSSVLFIMVTAGAIGLGILYYIKRKK